MAMDRALHFPAVTMKLVSEEPYWLCRNGKMQSYPRLERRAEADVIIVGAGITGALIGDELTRTGFEVILLDGRHVAHGSTAASTAILQYEIDTSLTNLIEWCGPAANDLYLSGHEACRRLQRLCEELDVDVNFRTRPSCYLASSPEDAELLPREFELRRAIGLPVEFWDEAQVRSQFDFSAPAALWSEGCGEVDPYRLTHALLRRIRQRGGRVFSETKVRDVTPGESSMTFHTDGGSAEGKYGVIAAGYESRAFLPENVAELKSTYAFATQPLQEFPGWPRRCLIWETARPYLYLRSTVDGRMLAGGADLPFQNERLRDQMLPQQIAALEARVRAMFPRISLKVDNAWAGTFGETKDGLPFIGGHRERPRLLFALCFGGNGMTFSVLAAELIREQLLGRKHPLAEAVGFERESLKKATSQSR
jgi:glycine/D-amino acid oxidase-like deaminating enzyme